MAPWKRTYWVVFTANLITAVGMMSFLPFFPALLEDLGVADLERRMLWSGILTGAAPLAAAVMGPVWGSLGDRVGRKPMLIRALVAIALFVGAMGLARGPWELLALRVGQGLFSGFIPPSVTLVSVAAPRELQGRVAGTLQSALPLGMILGPIVGANLQLFGGFDQLFLFVATAAGASALLVALFAYEDPSLRLSIERFSPTSVLASTLGDLRLVLANERLRSGLIALAATQLAVGSTTPQLQLFVEELTPGGPGRAVALTGWLFTAMAVAGLIATPLWGRVGDALGHGRALGVAALASALALGGSALVPTYAFLFAARCALGLASPGVGVSAFGLATTETSNERRGGAVGAVFSARAFALSIGSALGGVLAPWLGLRGLFGISAAGLALAVLAVRSGGRSR